MDILTAISNRHSVRAYKDIPLTDEHKTELIKEAERLSNLGGVSLILVTDEPRAFTCPLSSYGKFKCVKNYLVLIRKKTDGNEKLGYYGEKFVLKAQSLGVNSCWVALTYSKTAIPVKPKKDEKIVGVIALGYGETQGVAHKGKPLSSLFESDTDIIPEWFMSGVISAEKAPTAVNQQRFVFTYKNGTAKAYKKAGFYTELDLGIVKCHFEIGANKDGLFGL